LLVLVGRRRQRCRPSDHWVPHCVSNVGLVHSGSGCRARLAGGDSAPRRRARSACRGERVGWGCRRQRGSSPRRRSRAIGGGRVRSRGSARSIAQWPGCGFQPGEGGVAFMIGGEAGSGKSRLADKLARDARRRGARVVWGRCWEAGGAPAYWPWVQVLRSRQRRPPLVPRHRGKLAAGADPRTARALTRARLTAPPNRTGRGFSCSMRWRGCCARQPMRSPS
jgi:AAA ATPase-like protein